MVILRTVEPPPLTREADLKSFLCEHYWLPEEDFPLCGDVFHALGMRGDDCLEFMSSYAEIFNVDLSDYIWPKFHLGEAEALDVRAALRPLRRFVGLKANPLDRDLVPISIDHLLGVSERGQWFDPAHEQKEQSASLGRSLSRMGARLRSGGVPRRRS